MGRLVFKMVDFSRFLSGFSTDLSTNIGGDSDMGLINVTKKEQRTTNLDQRDFSVTSAVTSTDSRSFSLTNAPTLVFGSAGGDVGATTSVSAETSVTPTIQTKKEASASISQKEEQAQGLLEGIADKALLIAAVGGVGYLFVTGKLKPKKSKGKK